MARRRKGEDEEEGGEPEQIQLTSIKQVASAGEELAALVCEMQDLEEAKLASARRYRNKIKEASGKIKNLSVAIHSQAGSPKEAAGRKEEAA